MLVKLIQIGHSKWLFKIGFRQNMLLKCFYSIEIKSPWEVEVDWIAPVGNSITKAALKYIEVRRPGDKEEIVFTIIFALFTNSTSMAKCIKNVCMELHGVITRPSLAKKTFLPSKPLILVPNLTAITASSAKTVFLVLLIIFI